MTPIQFVSGNVDASFGIAEPPVDGMEAAPEITIEDVRALYESFVCDIAADKEVDRSHLLKTLEVLDIPNAQLWADVDATMSAAAKEELREVIEAELDRQERCPRRTLERIFANARGSFA